MSEFVQCPTCGKSTAVEHFHPEDLDLDIKLITMKGLGKGRGFEVVNRRSALEDAEVDVIEPIKNRTLDILKILIQSGYLTLDKVEEFLNEDGIEDSDEDDDKEFSEEKCFIEGAWVQP